MKADEKLRIEYQIRQDTIREEIFALNGARQEGIDIGMEKGIDIGMEKGIDIGMEKGIDIGMEKGAEEEKIKNVRSVLDVLDNETIAQKFEIDILEVKKLRQEFLEE